MFFGYGYGYRNGVRGFWKILNIEFLLSGISDFKISFFPESKFVNAYLELSIIGLFFFISIFIVKLLFCKAKNFFI